MNHKPSGNASGGSQQEMHSQGDHYAPGNVRGIVAKQKSEHSPGKRRVKKTMCVTTTVGLPERRGLDQL